MFPKKTICLDFDGVIHAYTTPWQAAHIIPDAPVPGAFDFITECLDNGFRVAVFSSRSHQLGGTRAMQSWFQLHHFPDTDHIDFPQEKPPAVLYIDDRGFHFQGTFPSMDFLKSFQPWNRKQNKTKKYRLLQPGEPVELGDELYDEDVDGTMKWVPACPGGLVGEDQSPIRREDFAGLMAWPKPDFRPNPQISGDGVKINIDDKEKILP